VEIEYLLNDLCQAIQLLQSMAAPNTQTPKLTARQQYNNNYGGGYGQSNPYDNAPPPQYGKLDLTKLP
jgi:hypothetical protein